MMSTFLKATDGRHWYLSIDGETFDLCKKEPFLQDKITADVDNLTANEPVFEGPVDEILSRQQLEERGFTISEVTPR